MEADTPAGTIQVEVAYATPAKQLLLSVEVPQGCTAAQAIELSGIREEIPEKEVDPNRIGIFSQKISPDHELRDGDRVEIYRPLVADPKEMRKLRAQMKQQ